MNRPWILFMSVAVVSCNGTASAAPYRFSGGGIGGLINVDIEGGSYPDKRVTLTPTVAVNFDVDPVATSVHFNKVEAAGGPFTSVQSESFLVPGTFNELRLITTTLSFDAFNAVATNTGPLDLVSNVGTKYTIEEYRSSDRGGFFSLTLTGTYLVQGPTQSMSGPFSLVFPAAYAGGMFFTDNSTIDFAQFPTHAALDLSPIQVLVNFQDFPNYRDVFSDVVDGIPVDVKMLRVEFQLAPLTASAVPEPVGEMLVLLACVSWGLQRRRV